jgi:hypothetical protein
MKGNRGDNGFRGRDVGDGYKAYSLTTSGWSISVNDDAPADKRWRIVHELYGTRYFDNHDEIMEFTVKNMLERFEQFYKDVK